MTPCPTRRSRAVAAGVILLLAGALITAAPAGAKPAKTTKPAEPRKTTTSVSASRAVAGAPLALTARVRPRPTGGTMRFTIAGRTPKTCAKVAVRAGSARCAATAPAAGRRTVTVRYSGVRASAKSKHRAYRASSIRRTVTVAARPGTTPKPAAGTIVGSTGSCTTSKGALVAVSFATWSGPIVRGCDTTPTTGIDLLDTAGFTTAGTQHDGPQFLCRIGHALFDSGTQYPKPATESCVRTPPASAYWSYWLAPKGSNTWSYAQFGAYSQRTIDGDVQAWTYGATDVEGTTGKPAFTPNQVRAGSSATARSAPAAQRRAAPAPRADVGKATDYLLTAPNSAGDGPQLKDGHYYDQYDLGFADYGLTVDAVYALAASGSDDAALRRIMAFLDSAGTDGSDRSINDYTGVGTEYAGGGSVGKVALAALMTGYDPHAFAGHDLVATLAELVCTKAIDSVCAAPGNYRYSPSTFAQALPIIAQLRAGDAKGAKRPIAYLESLQHASGAFPSVLPGADSETDSTGIAAMALALVPGAEARTRLAKALSWLASQQTADGGFPGAAGDSTNSAAIAIQALRLDAQTYATRIERAEAFLAAAQNADGGFDVDADADGSDMRATTQVLGGVVGTPFGSVLDDLDAKDVGTSGATYLVDQLTGGDHYETVYDGTAYPDQGLTADGVFALLATGGHAASVSAMTSYLEKQVDAYADPTGANFGPYSGSLAKLALVAEATGGDPHSFGGADLLAVLAANVCTEAQGAGQPCVAVGDFRNNYATVSQALGVLALQASPDDGDHLAATDPAVVRLHQLQCDDGGFASTLRSAGDGCTSDVDTTGYAVQALAAVAGTDTWIGAAQHYLQDRQRTTGLFPGAAGDNANSTALAADALQSLVTALTSPTADPPQPQTITPIAPWQSSLRGLRSLATPAGGFALTGGAAPDLRASTQAVAAAAQRSLLELSGATILSLPRAAAADPPAVPGGGSSSGGTPSGPGTTSSAAGHGSGSPGTETSGAVPNGDSASPVADGAAGTADTGVPTLTLLLWAAALLTLGAALSVAARRGARPGRGGTHR